MYFFIPLLILGFLLEYMLRSIPNEYTLKRDYLAQEAENIETLVLGSSHAYFGIDPKYFNNQTFNAANLTQSLNYDYEIFYKYKNQFTSLKTIVLPISYFSLYSKLEEETEKWRVKNYVIYFNINKYNNSISNNFELLNGYQLHNLQRLILYYLKPSKSILTTELGWGTDYHSSRAKNLEATGKSAAKRHTITDRNSIENQRKLNENLTTIDKFVHWTKKNKVNLLFVTLPTHQSYQKNIDNEQLRFTSKTIETICSNYEHCKYFNIFNSSDFNDTDFYDGDHLSEIGTKKLSKLLNNNIKKYSKAK